MGRNVLILALYCRDHGWSRGDQNSSVSTRSQRRSDAVRSGGTILHAGRQNVKWFFQRTGQGTFAAYQIAAGSADGDEAVGGCYGIVSAGAVVDGPDHNGLKAKSGCAA